MAESGNAVTVEELQIRITAEYGDAIRQMLKMVEEVKKTLSAKLEPAAKAVDKAMDSMEPSVKRAAQAVKKSVDDMVVEGRTLDGIIDGVIQKTKSASKYTGAVGKVDPDTLKNIGRVNESYEKLNRLLESTETSTAFQKTDAAVKNTAKSVRKIEPAAKAAKTALSGIPKVLDSALPPTVSLVKQAEKFTKLGLGIVLGKMKNSFSGLNKHLRSFAGNIRNVLTFGLIYKAINTVSDALRTGIDNLYQYSKTINGTFAASMDRLSAGMQYFKNSVGAAVSPIVTALTPVIDMAVDHIVELINSLNQLIAKLSGASTWTKAIKVQKEYAEATESAAEAQKGMLAGFDELNVVQQQSGGNSSGSVDYGSMFEEVPLDGYTLPDFVQQIKERIEQGDWAGVGQTLGEKVNAVVAGIDWAAAGERLGNGLQNMIDTYNGFMRTVDWSGIGSGIGESLNHLMANVDFESAGAAFAQGWNALVGMIHGFVTTTDWKAVGSSIAGAINGWFDEIDWTLLGRTLSEGVKSLLAALRTAIQETDWRSIGGSISEMLNQIDWSAVISDAFGLLSDAIKGILDFLIGAIQGLDWYDLGTEVYESITETLQNIDFDGMASRLMEGIGSALAGLAQFLIGVVSSAWEDLIGWWKEAAFKDGEFTMQGLLEGIWQKIKDIGTWLKTNVADPFINGFKKLFGINSPSTVMAELGGFLVLGLLEGLKSAWTDITTWITTSFNWIKTKVTAIFTEVKKAVVGIWEGMWSTVKGVINTILGGIEKFANGIVGGINKVIDTLNSFDLDIPAFSLFGKEFGGTSIGFNLSRVSEVSIPRLASGAVITSPTLGLMGEYPNAASNPEIVTPQKLLYETVTSANAEQNALLREQNNLLRQLLRKEVAVNIGASAALGKVNRRSEELYAAIAGG